MVVNSLFVSDLDQTRVNNFLLPADKALFNLQLAATYISFMLSHSSEEPVCDFTPFVHHAFDFYLGGLRLLKKQCILDTLFAKLKNPPSSVQINGLPENVVPITASTNVVRAALLKDTAV